MSRGRKFTFAQRQIWKANKQDEGYKVAEATPFRTKQNREEELKQIEEFIKKRGVMKSTMAR